MQLFLQTALRLDELTRLEREVIGSTEICAHVDMSDVRKAVDKHPPGQK